MLVDCSHLLIAFTKAFSKNPFLGIYCNHGIPWNQIACTTERVLVKPSHFYYRIIKLPQLIKHLLIFYPINQRATGFVLESKNNWKHWITCILHSKLYCKYIYNNLYKKKSSRKTIHWHCRIYLDSKKKKVYWLLNKKLCFH